MARELVYTSAPAGLRPGSRGYCTVAHTRGLAPRVIERLEGMSGYRPAFPAGDPRAARNPVSWSHALLQLDGRRCSVLSRVGACGTDYSGRSNKLAHHLLLSADERPKAGPAWLLSQPGLMRDSWQAEPQLLDNARTLPQGVLHPGIPRSWQALTGDAGWAGVLAESFAGACPRPAFLIFEPGIDLLPLFVEASALLPADQRWQVTFSTYLHTLPSEGGCLWRGCLSDAPVLKAARRSADPLVIDLRLREQLGRAPDGPCVRAARHGAQVPPRPAMPRPAVAKAPQPVQPTVRTSRVALKPAATAERGGFPVPVAVLVGALLLVVIAFFLSHRGSRARIRALESELADALRAPAEEQPRDAIELRLLESRVEAADLRLATAQAEVRDLQSRLDHNELLLRQKQDELARLLVSGAPAEAAVATSLPEVGPDTGAAVTPQAVPAESLAFARRFAIELGLLPEAVPRQTLTLELFEAPGPDAGLRMLWRAGHGLDLQARASASGWELGSAALLQMDLPELSVGLSPEGLVVQAAAQLSEERWRSVRQAIQGIEVLDALGSLQSLFQPLPVRVLPVAVEPDQGGASLQIGLPWADAQLVHSRALSLRVASLPGNLSLRVDARALQEGRLELEAVFLRRRFVQLSERLQACLEALPQQLRQHYRVFRIWLETEMLAIGALADGLLDVCAPPYQLEHVPQACETLRPLLTRLHSPSAQLGAFLPKESSDPGVEAERARLWLGELTDCLAEFRNWDKPRRPSSWERLELEVRCGGALLQRLQLKFDGE